MGRRYEAVEASQEAVNLYERFVTKFDDLTHALAMTLSNLAVSLKDVGRTDDALPLAQRSVDLYEAMAKNHDPFFLPEPAPALINLCNILHSLGQNSDVLKASKRSCRVLSDPLCRTSPCV